MHSFSNHQNSAIHDFRYEPHNSSDSCTDPSYFMIQAMIRIAFPAARIELYDLNWESYNFYN